MQWKEKWSAYSDYHLYEIERKGHKWGLWVSDLDVPSDAYRIRFHIGDHESLRGAQRGAITHRREYGRGYAKANRIEDHSDQL